jgi:hypothetical protein
MKYRDVLYKWNYASVMTDQQKWSKVSLMARLDMGWSLVDVDSDLVGTWPAPKDRVNWDPGPMAKLETHIWKYRWTSFCDHTWYANDIAYIYIFSHTHIYIYIPIVDLQSYCWGTQRASGSQRNSSLKRKFPVPKKTRVFPGRFMFIIKTTLKALVDLPFMGDHQMTIPTEWCNKYVYIYIHHWNSFKLPHHIPITLYS